MSKNIGGTALVLGGGGVGGIAWMTGLLLGLEDEGVDIRSAVDLLIGTSAGATVAAQIAGDTRLIELYQRQVDPQSQVAELVPDPQLLEQLRISLPELVKLSDPLVRMRQIWNLAADTKTVDSAQRRAVIAARLPVHQWPERPVQIVAIDIATGEPRLFERDSGVDLVDAVAASCAVPGIWPPVTIGANRYMDGGVRSTDNADFAAGFSTVIVLSPLGAGGATLMGNASLPMQVEALRSADVQVLVLEPDEASKKAIGPNPLSPETRMPAAMAGRAQGRALALEEGQSSMLGFLGKTARG